MPPRSAQRANGSLSARQWADLRQAARLARSENVTIQWRGTNNITILPGPPRGDRPGEKEQAMRTAPPRNEGSRRPPEPEAPRNNSKKQQRDADRRHDHVPKGCVASWLHLTQAALRRSRWQECQAVWTVWMRSRLSPRRDARRKLRLAFWREWTRPQFEPNPGIPATADYPRQLGFADLGRRSHRDEYLLQRVRARCARLTDACPHALCLRKVRYWVGGEWPDPGGGEDLNQADKKSHLMLMDQLRKWLPCGSDGGTPDAAALRRVDPTMRRQMTEYILESRMLSPRTHDLSRALTALEESLSGANESSGTSAGGRKGGTRGRDDPSLARADRKRGSRR